MWNRALAREEDGEVDPIAVAWDRVDGHHCGVRRERSVPNLCQDLLYDPAMHVSQAKITAIVTVGKFPVIEAKLMKNSGVEIMHMDVSFHSMMSKLIGSPVGGAGLEAPSG